MTDDEIDDMTVDSAIKTIKQLRNQLEDYKECFANLAKERDELWEDLERVTKERDEARRDACKLAVIAQGADDVEGVEDCCQTCEPVGILNIKLQEERDRARRMAAHQYANKYAPDDEEHYDKLYRDYFAFHKWDCFKDEPKS